MPFSEINLAEEKTNITSWLLIKVIKVYEIRRSFTSWNSGFSLNVIKTLWVDVMRI